MPPGRPREFDPEKALDKALKVFWRRGYEGASLPELTKAMGINRPSLYATFGNKEALFRRAVERYVAGPANYIPQALQEPTARRVAERILHGAVELLSDPKTPPGCLMVHGALTCAEGGESVRRALADQRAAGEGAIRARLERGVAEGDLPGDADPAALARYLSAVIFGLCVLAAGGRISREGMMEVADVALRAWPSE